MESSSGLKSSVFAHSAVAPVIRLIVPRTVSIIFIIPSKIVCPRLFSSQASRKLFVRFPTVLKILVMISMIFAKILSPIPEAKALS